MTSSRAQHIIDQLQAFSASMTQENSQDLERILEGLPHVEDPEAVLPSIFGVMERFPEADLGSPGPLVHEAEAIENYTEQLAASLARQPSMLTLWMVNRVLNATEDEGLRMRWLASLRSVAESDVCSGALRLEATAFLVRHGGDSAA